MARLQLITKNFMISWSYNIKQENCLDENNNIFQTTRFNHTMILV